MNLSVIKTFVTSKAARQLLTVQKHSPVLLFGAGVVGVTATVVLACKGTLKLDGILEDHQKNLQDLENAAPDLDEKVHMQAKTIIYTKTVMDIGKIYAPAVAIGVVSIGCLTGSHIVLTRRNAGLTAAYAALDKGFREYRKRVEDEFGVEKEREMRYDTIKVAETNDKGERVTVTKIDPDGNEHSIYARLWGRDTSTSWVQDPSGTYNLVFLRAQQQILTDRLRAKGHLFLNEVYDDLGLERTPAGQIVGWVMGNGDDYVDLGIFNDKLEPQHLAFFTGREDHVLLDFNVDGPVHELI